MYVLKREKDMICTSDIARLMGIEWHVASYDTKRENFPKPKKIGLRDFWNKAAVIKFYKNKK